MNITEAFVIHHFFEEENNKVIEYGVHERIFLNKDDAINQMYEMSDNKMNDLIDEYGERWDKDAIGDEIYRDSVSNGGIEMVTVFSPRGTYEYSVVTCSVDKEIYKEDNNNKN